MAERYLNGQKTLWEKKKLLVTSNFSLFYSVFKRLELETRKNQGLFGKGLNARTKDFLEYIPSDDLFYFFGETDYEGDIFNLEGKTGLC